MKFKIFSQVLRNKINLLNFKKILDKFLIYSLFLINYSFILPIQYSYFIKGIIKKIFNVTLIFE